MSENYRNEDLREAIGILLSMIDEMSPPEMHWRGNSPDWYVAAASMACNIEDVEPKCITYLRKGAIRQ